MAEVPDADRFTQARIRAHLSLQSRFWSSLKLSFVALGVGLGAGGAVLQGLAAAGSLVPGTGWFIVGIGAGAFPFSLLGLELHRLLERADALRELFEAQREYESLLARARAERDEFREKAVALAHQNEGIRTVATLVGLGRGRSREDLEP